jgi:hypothetical protein
MRSRQTVKILTVFLFTTVMASCSSFSTVPNASLALKLDNVDMLKIGETTRADAEKIFGKADKTLIVAKLTGKDVWLYLGEEHKSTRLSLIFESSTGKLANYGWFVREGDPETDFAYITNRYQAQFEKLPRVWPKGQDAGPSTEVFLDKRSGLEIEFSAFNNRVESISKSPTRILSRAVDCSSKKDD